jgi:hypothetical protein
MVKRMFRSRKAQSAMEYLMTYGWAILIIAVVLGALFSLGVFSGASLIGNACIAGPGFLCNGMALSHTTGYLGITIGQSTGTNWGNTIFMYAVQGNSILTNGPVVPGNGATLATNIINGAFISGQTTTVYLQALPASSAVGTSSAGSIWACYTTSSTNYMTYTTATGTCFSGTNSIYYTQLATLTVKAT